MHEKRLAGEIILEVIFLKSEEDRDLPIGFTMALFSNEEAMGKYASLPENQRQEILAQARQIRSSEEMHSFVDSFFS